MTSSSSSLVTKTERNIIVIHSNHCFPSVHTMFLLYSTGRVFPSTVSRSTNFRTKPELTTSPLLCLYIPESNASKFSILHKKQKSQSLHSEIHLNFTGITLLPTPAGMLLAPQGHYYLRHGGKHSLTACHARHLLVSQQSFSGTGRLFHQMSPQCRIYATIPSPSLPQLPICLIKEKLERVEYRHHFYGQQTWFSAPWSILCKHGSERIEIQRRIKEIRQKNYEMTKE